MKKCINIFLFVGIAIFISCGDSKKEQEEKIKQDSISDAYWKTHETKDVKDSAKVREARKKNLEVQIFDEVNDVVFEYFTDKSLSKLYV